MNQILQSLQNSYWKIEQLVVPGLRNSQHLYVDELKMLLKNDTMWLDLGCGHQFFPDWMRDSSHEQLHLKNVCEQVVGVDYDFPSLLKNNIIDLKIRGDIQQLPFKSNYFNLISANMVFEHIHSPNILLKEIKRVLNPEGLLIFHTPNLLNYTTFIAKHIPQKLKTKLIKYLESRDEEDVFPTHYLINTPREISKYADEFGFQVEKLIMINSTAETGILGPLAIFELSLIRLLNISYFKNYRSNIIAILRKKDI